MVALSSVIELSERIAKEFDPEKIILFGSHAYGAPHEYSDVDLLVVMAFEGSGLDKSLEILDRTDPRFPIDLIVRRPDDTERRYREFDPLIREALDRGRMLYERDGEKVTHRVPLLSEQCGGRAGDATAATAVAHPIKGTVTQWTTKAEGHYKTARREFRRKADRNMDAVCFHAHQCVEKLMKAVLVSRGVSPEYTHNLVYLDTTLKTVAASWTADVDELSWLNRAGVAFRYPGEWATDAHASRAMAICERLREALLKLIDEGDA